MCPLRILIIEKGVQMLQPFYSEGSRRPRSSLLPIGIMIRTWANSSWTFSSRPWWHWRWWSTKVNTDAEVSPYQIEQTTRASKRPKHISPSPKMGKGKTEMPEYEDKQYEGNKSSDSLDSEFGAFDVPIMRTVQWRKLLPQQMKNFFAPPKKGT